MTPVQPVASATRPHPRGIFEAEHTFPGVSTFRVYDCAGRLLERREVETELVDAQTWTSLNGTLEHYCPADPARHTVICSDHGRPHALRLMER